MERKTVLVTVSYLVEVDEREINKDFGVLDQITNQISKDIKVTGDEDTRLKWEGTSRLLLDSEIVNCGRCVKCEGWVTDREKPNPVSGLCDGATVNGQLLCDECLPPNHRWAF